MVRITKKHLNDMKTENNWALHAVKFHNTDLEKAKEDAKKFIKKKVHFYRVLKSGLISFRNIPKTKFNPKTYRSKKINDNITLVYGQLKPEFQHLSGDGLIDDLFTLKRDYNNTSKATLQKYGDKKIIRLQLYRTPIQSFINSVMNILSLGKWDEIKQRYGYDKLFHLAMIATLDNNKNIIIEKNSVVNISDYYETKPDTQVLNIDLLGKELTPNGMLKLTLDNIGAEQFFIYDGATQNCQFFLKNILQTNGLYNPDIHKWLFQDMRKIFEAMPGFLHPISKIATNVSAWFNKILGYGIMEKEFNLSDHKNEIIKKFGKKFYNELVFIEKNISKK